mgnify:CR=1 FL=1
MSFISEVNDVACVCCTVAHRSFELYLVITVYLVLILIVRTAIHTYIYVMSHYALNLNQLINSFSQPAPTRPLGDNSGACCRCKQCQTTVVVVLHYMYVCMHECMHVCMVNV